jgi:isoleucyl-tRNA synthetase
MEEALAPVSMEQVLADIPTIMAAHGAVKLALEQARKSKKIGSSLQSHIVITIEDEAVMRRYADELASMFVVSGCELNAPVPTGEGEVDFHYTAEFEVGGQTATVHVLPPRDAKCPRCWRYVAPAEDQLCGRCGEVTAEMAVEAEEVI